MDTFFGLDPEVVAEVALFIIGLGIVVAAVIDACKTFGWVKPDQAGKWNKLLSTVAGLAILVLTQLGKQGEVAGTQAYAVQIAAVVVSILGIAVSAKLTRYVLKWLGPKAEGPVG